MKSKGEIEIGIHYYPDEIDNLDYLGLLKHEMIHIRLHYLCRKNIKPVIQSSTLNRNGYEWFRCECDMNFTYGLITITIFFRILISSILSMIYDLIFYVLKRTFYLIRSTIVDHLSTILHYLFRMIKENRERREYISNKKYSGDTIGDTGITKRKISFKQVIPN